MAERRMQYKLGLLQYYCSQQDTIPNPAIQLSKILPSKVIPQTGTQYTEPDARGRERFRAVPSDIDMTTYHPAISITFSSILEQAIPTTPYPLDRVMPTISYPMLDQAMPPMSDAELDQGMAVDAHAKENTYNALSCYCGCLDIRPSFLPHLASSVSCIVSPCRHAAKC